jgi:hypothetical protein
LLIVESKSYVRLSPFYLISVFHKINIDANFSKNEIFFVFL